jgi:hypothetical protein
MMVLGGLRCCGGHHGGLAAPEEWITDWTQALQRLIDRIRPCFQRPEPRRRVGRVVAGLLSEVERAGEATPDGMQRLLDQAKWDAERPVRRWSTTSVSAWAPQRGAGDR